MAFKNLSQPLGTVLGIAVDEQSSLKSNLVHNATDRPLEWKTLGFVTVLVSELR